MKQDERITRRHRNLSNGRINDAAAAAAIPDLEDGTNNHECPIHNRMSTKTVSDDGRPRPRQRLSRVKGRNQFSYRLFQRQIKVYLRRNPEIVYVIATAIIAGTWLICWAFSTLITQYRRQQPRDTRRAQQHHPRRDVGNTYTIPLELSNPSHHKKYENIMSDVDGEPLKLPSKKQRGDKKTKRSSINNDRKARLVPKSDKRTAEDPHTTRLVQSADPNNVSLYTKESKANMGKGPPKSERETIHHQLLSNIPPFEVIFPTHLEPNRSVNRIFLPPENIVLTTDKDGLLMDFGGLDLIFFKDDGASRKIGRDNRLLETHFRDYNDKDTRQDDDVETYYAFDDDEVRNQFVEQNQEGREGKFCRRVAEHRLNFQNCNTFHETPLLESNVKYLNEGTYRQVVAIDHSFGNQVEKIAVKDISYYREVEYSTVEYTRIDGTIAERLTGSPRIYDIYGMCGIGIMSEFFPHGDFERYAIPGDGYLNPTQIKESMLNDVKSHNDLSSHDKLKFALHMAEAIADLHGYKFGVMVHQDIQLSQFLWTTDRSRLKLNDFNRAEVMLWDDEEGQYCKHTEGPGSGTWRSPEEYFDNPLDEKVDVFSLGNNIYGLLTGLQVFYDEHETEKVQDRVRHGEKAYIDPRFTEKSLAEAKLVEIITRCHQYHPADRPSIFEVVTFLTDALKEVEMHEEDSDSVDETES